MNKSTETINSLYGNKVRVRVCGLHVHDHKILLLKHRGLGSEGILWAPPGGGVIFGESLSTCLRREVLEETALQVTNEELLFIHEFIKDQLHAVEIFFKIETLNVDPVLGFDPEHAEQIIEDLKYFSEKEIYESDRRLFHQIFKVSRSFDELLAFKGYLKG